MYKRELDNLIASKKLPSSILLYGDSEYEISRYLRTIADMRASKDDRLVYYYDEFDYSSAKNYLSQTSLFGGENLLVIMTDKAIAKNEIESLIALAQKSSENFLIYHFSGEDAKAKRFAKYFSKKNDADFVRFFKPHMGEAIGMLSHYAQEQGMDIERYALEHLLHIQNGDVGLCVKELEKLSIYDRKIEQKDIDAGVYGLNAVSLEEFIKKIFLKKDIKEDIGHILESGVADEMRIIASIGQFCSKLFAFHAYIKINGSSNPKEILGFNPPSNIVRDYEMLAVKLTIDKFTQIYKHLMEVEHHLKTVQHIDKSSYFYHFLIKLQRTI
jgi:DNA polymerase-3 subunit delta